MRARIEYYRRTKLNVKEEYQIGCILIQAPFFFPTSDWLPVPDWHSNIVRGRGYDLTIEPGRSLWREIETRLQARHRLEADEQPTESPRYGEPVLVSLRLGQGTFRIKVLDAYSRRCAVTNEKVLPVLDAAHIRPFAEGGEHRVDNGLLLRSDFHALFDQGYVTVTPDHKLEVSRRLRTEFDDGKEYFDWHGRPIREPENRKDLPGRDFLVWHNENRFRG